MSSTLSGSPASLAAAASWAALLAARLPRRAGLPAASAGTGAGTLRCRRGAARSAELPASLACRRRLPACALPAGALPAAAATSALPESEAGAKGLPLRARLAARLLPTRG